MQGMASIFSEGKSAPRDFNLRGDLGNVYTLGYNKVAMKHCNVGQRKDMLRCTYM